MLKRPTNLENLQKALGWTGKPGSGTDYKQPATEFPTMTVGPTYRFPSQRRRGNHMFRRYMDGTLDYEYAKDIIVDLIHKVSEGFSTTNLEKLALSVCFPAIFDEIDPAVAYSLREAQLQISVYEAGVIASLVAAHLKEEMNWNAGQGGGSVPGRSVTRS